MMEWHELHPAMQQRILTERVIRNRLDQARREAGIEEETVRAELGFEVTEIEYGTGALTVGRFLDLCRLYGIDPGATCVVSPADCEAVRKRGEISA